MTNHTKTSSSFDPTPWIGAWKNFELYFTDEDPAMQSAWADAEEATSRKEKSLLERFLFRHGAKHFWMSGCYTATRENPTSLGGWNITPADASDLNISWTNQRDKVIADFTYTLETTLPSGLERKTNYLLRAKDAARPCPFRYLLLMEPMPSRDAKEKGGLISHLHFQYASNPTKLLRSNGTLKKPHWYATMCDATATKEQECAIVRALHGIK